MHSLPAYSSAVSKLLLVGLTVGVGVAVATIAAGNQATQGRGSSETEPGGARQKGPADERVHQREFPQDSSVIEFGRPATLPAPHTMTTGEFEAELFPFLESRAYVALGWAADKGVRDTGPFIDGVYYGTHPAVRVYYSPEVIEWLKGGRQGTIPDGAMIVKEQYPPPAIKHQGKSAEELRKSLESWTVMVKDSAGSYDGWFWSNPAANPKVNDNSQFPFDHPVSGFGLYCVRCHASTKSPIANNATLKDEFTFASLRNIKGFPGEPILFRVDDSWRAASAEASTGEEASESVEDHERASGSHPACTANEGVAACRTRPNEAFHTFFDAVASQERDEVEAIPPITHDWVPQDTAGSREFLTSNQCMSCHAGLMKPFGPTMFVPTGDDANYGDSGWNISPYGEWRWTPMGLAGRDPVFLAQLESELVQLKQEFPADEFDELADTVTHTCFRCHGVMGHHQQAVDHGLREKFDNENHTATLTNSEPTEQAEGRRAEKQLADYGALARDGVSCMVCHRAQKLPQREGDDRPYLKHFFENGITGRMHYGKRGEIYGPYKDNEIKPYVMQHATGLTPKHDAYLRSSQLCGSCHTVNLPAVDKPIELGRFGGHDAHSSSDAELIASESERLFKRFHHHLEQATYLEWLNSEYQDEFDPGNPLAKSCQECHMSRGLSDPASGIDLEQLQTRMAIVQDRTYPDAENLTSLDNLDIVVREEGYRRHNFSGLNLFLLEMFNQHNDILGVRKTDYMTGSKEDIAHAVENFVQTAQLKTAEIELTAADEGPRTIRAKVLVHNKAGHRFPSGVGFRRAFIELIVRRKDSNNGSSEPIWASGRTNELGVLVDDKGEPLAEELFTPREDGTQRFHPHHTVINSQSQTQVYETLLQDNQGKFTTSFLHGCKRIKDNRLLPRGWTADGPAPEALSGVYLQATHPGALSKGDPRYSDGSGSDEVEYVIALPVGVDARDVVIEATLYYQALPPYFLKMLFDAAPDGPATQRLHFLCANLDLTGTPIENWKLQIVKATTKVAP